MNQLFEKFIAFNEKKKLIKPGRKVLLALSGGADSMALATLLQRAKIPFVIGHINFQLRGDESDMDQEIVLNWAKQNKIEAFTISFETEKTARENE